jgi:hypothetical protein
LQVLEVKRKFCTDSRFGRLFSPVSFQLFFQSHFESILNGYFNEAAAVRSSFRHIFIRAADSLAMEGTGFLGHLFHVLSRQHSGFGRLVRRGSSPESAYNHGPRIDSAAEIAGSAYATAESSSCPEEIFSHFIRAYGSDGSDNGFRAVITLLV